MKTYTIISQAWVRTKVQAENKEEALEKAVNSPVDIWKVSSLSEEYHPMVFEGEEH